jgi:7-cyano-7-deazaguanine synthase
MRKAVVLLSGGLDSTTALAMARADNYVCHALTVIYGQTHRAEIEAARRVARALSVEEHKVIEIDLSALAQSALTDRSHQIPKDRSLEEIGREGDVPPTYVPARNTVLMSLALSWAESIGARDLFLGVNVLDASGYPDCRPAFVTAFEMLANVATRVVFDKQSQHYHVHAPLIEMTKKQIIQTGIALGVDYAITHSCYDPKGDLACGRCDACQLRAKGFREAGVPDPTRYLGTHV